MVLELDYKEGIEMYILSRKDDVEEMFNKMYLSLYPYMQLGHMKSMGLQEFKDLYDKNKTDNCIATKELTEEEEEKLLDELDKIEAEGRWNDGSI